MADALLPGALRASPGALSELALFQDFCYRYPETKVPALDQISFPLERGLTILGGPSGSGKTTLLRSLNGLVPHFHGGQVRGRAWILGHDLRTTSTRRLSREVAMVFQEPESQFVMATVRREVAFGPENLGLPAAEIGDRVEDALRAMGILNLADRWIATLSGGQRQRVALAASLAMRPRILVLDEPTSQLDDSGADSLRRECQALAGRGLAVVVAEHRPWRVDSTGSQRLELSHGSLLAEAPAKSGPGTLPRGTARPVGSPAWQLRDLSVGHQQAVATGIDLECRQGEVLCLTGINGSGKTTLLRTVAGLLPPLSGSVNRRPGRRAYLPQEAGSVLHQASLVEEVSQTIRWLRLECRPGPVLEELQLTDVASFDPRDLSTGQRQRAALAAVLVGSPEMVFLDEPTRGADQTSRVLLLRILERLATEGAAILVATSDSQFARQLGDRVLELDSGHLREPGERAA
ncbi:MAG TPA: ATP-binding cassette domain-containing protein [Candidatus Micrarchaeaceae archaeon]|nr:ATP-binding cassette domain-containing protein [Candidatus Micrarchaeaceae archaeon]